MALGTVFLDILISQWSPVLQYFGYFEFSVVIISEEATLCLKINVRS